MLNLFIVCETDLSEQVESKKRESHNPYSEVNLSVKKPPMIGLIRDAKELESERDLDEPEYHLDTAEPTAAPELCQQRREQRKQCERESKCSQTMSILQAVVLHMLALVNYNLTTRDKTDDKLDAAINYVKKYMADHLSDPIDVPALAAERGMSYTWLRRMFRKNTGMAPAQYLQQLRIHMSMYLLRNTSLPIKNVAVDSGFKTSEYFCSVFQETVGMTPRAYRAANNGARQPETDATKRGA